MLPEIGLFLAAVVASGLAVAAGARLAARQRRRSQVESTRRVLSQRGLEDRLIAFRSGLAKTRQLLVEQVRAALGRDRTVASWLSNLEETLILADVGAATSARLVDALRRRPALGSPDEVLAALRAEVLGILSQGPTPQLEDRGEKPLVVLVVGVNGVGKTTTIGKLAHRLVARGKKVLLVAGDTFRPAAIEQLGVWAQRTGSDFVKQRPGADPSAVVYDGIQAARSRGADVVLIDTAGRLHVKVNLMEELKKIVRVAGRALPGAPHEIFLVLDAATGQNALSQARLFRAALPLSGLVLTKLDGTAKGGVVLAIKSELDLPIRYVGLGEALEDLREFDPQAFADGLFEGAAVAETQRGALRSA